jgi:hypothetical protein
MPRLTIMFQMVADTFIKCLVGTTVILDVSYAFPFGPSPKAFVRWCVPREEQVSPERIFLRDRAGLHLAFFYESKRHGLSNLGQCF